MCELLAAGELLGVLQQEPSTWFAASPKARLVDVAHVERLLEARADARKARDFAASDRIRGELDALGVTIEDRADGTKWRMRE